MPVRYLGRVLVALIVLSIGATFAQEEYSVQFASRITNCIGAGSQGLDITGLCNVTAFVETSGIGLFTQISPKYGPFWENWQLRVYRPRVLWDAFGIQFQSQPGLTSGLQQGAWFIRLEVDTVFSIRW